MATAWVLFHRRDAETRRGRREENGALRWLRSAEGSGSVNASLSDRFLGGEGLGAFSPQRRRDAERKTRRKRSAEAAESAEGSGSANASFSDRFSGGEELGVFSPQRRKDAERKTRRKRESAVWSGSIGSGLVATVLVSPFMPLRLCVSAVDFESSLPFRAAPEAHRDKIGFTAASEPLHSSRFSALSSSLFFSPRLCVSA